MQSATAKVKLWIQSSEAVEVDPVVKLTGGVASQTDGTVNLQCVDSSGHLQCDIAASSAFVSVNGRLYGADYGELTQLAGNAALDLSGYFGACVTAAAYKDAGGAGRTVYLAYTDDAVTHPLGDTLTTAANGVKEVTAGKDITFKTTAGSTTNDLKCVGGNAADVWSVAVRLLVPS